MTQIQEWLADGVASANTTLQLVAAILFMHDDNLKEAVKLVHRGVNLEQNALLVQLYLRMDRLDLAQKQVSGLRRLGAMGRSIDGWRWMKQLAVHILFGSRHLCSFIPTHPLSLSCSPVTVIPTHFPPTVISTQFPPTVTHHPGQIHESHRRRQPPLHAR